MAGLVRRIPRRQVVPRAPVRVIQSIPFITSRGSRHGRPRPSRRTLDFGSSGAMSRHWRSVRSIGTLQRRVRRPALCPEDDRLNQALHHLRDSFSPSSGRPFGGLPARGMRRRIVRHPRREQTPQAGRCPEQLQDYATTSWCPRRNQVGWIDRHTPRGDSNIDVLRNPGTLWSKWLSRFNHSADPYAIAEAKTAGGLHIRMLYEQSTRRQDLDGAEQRVTAVGVVEIDRLAIGHGKHLLPEIG